MMYVSDVRKAVRFYERAAGAVCDHVHADGSYAELRLGSMTVGVVEADYAERHFPGEFRRHDPLDDPAAFEIYLEVDDLDEAIAQALAAGATQMSAPTERPWGQRNVFLRDRDGVVIEFASPQNGSRPVSDTT
jgi:lactoylglutathione lyase